MLHHTLVDYISRSTLCTVFYTVQQGSSLLYSARYTSSTVFLHRGHDSSTQVRRSRSLTVVGKPYLSLSLSLSLLPSSTFLLAVSSGHKDASLVHWSHGKANDTQIHPVELMHQLSLKRLVKQVSRHREEQTRFWLQRQPLVGRTGDLTLVCENETGRGVLFFGNLCCFFRWDPISGCMLGPCRPVFISQRPVFPSSFPLM